MARLIQNELKSPLADEILFGELSGGGVAHVTLESDALTVNFVASPCKR